MAYETDTDYVRVMLDKPTLAHAAKELSTHNYKTLSDVVTRIAKRTKNNNVRLPAQTSDALQELTKFGLAERVYTGDFPTYRLTLDGRKTLEAYRQREKEFKAFSSARP